MRRGSARRCGGEPGGGSPTSPSVSFSDDEPPLEVEEALRQAAEAVAEHGGAVGAVGAVMMSPRRLHTRKPDLAPISSRKSSVAGILLPATP